MPQTKETKYIFITGGVVSSLGKGVASASIALLLNRMGFKAMPKKLDPYLNIDPGTMNPAQHGEVFVTDDGSECDLDLGHYERFTGLNTGRDNSITAGLIYQKLLENERKGKYLGATVQIIPHVTNLIQDFIFKKKEENDIIICEVGGTVGDMEALPFFEAIRQVRLKHKDNVLFIHLTYIPYLESSGEIKTKPTQHSVKELMSIGIVPDILLCRSTVKISKEEKRKIALFCNVSEDSVVEASEVSNIYEVPICYANQNLHNLIAQKLKLQNIKDPNLDCIKKLISSVENAKITKTVAIVGKYPTKDSYKSILESLMHASMYLGIKTKVKILDVKKEKDISSQLSTFDAIIIAGGFGTEGVDGKIEAIKYARENNVPILGICYGMQLMVIEALRNMAKINATSEEIKKSDDEVIAIGFISSFEKDGQIHKREKTGEMGGTMRLGSYKANLKEGSAIHKIYNSSFLEERHRHRYEVDISQKENLEKCGLTISGISPDGKLPEVIENSNLKFFIGVQFHPELKSKLLNPAPLFVNLLK